MFRYENIVLHYHYYEYLNVDIIEVVNAVIQFTNFEGDSI